MNEAPGDLWLPPVGLPQAPALLAECSNQQQKARGSHTSQGSAGVCRCDRGLNGTKEGCTEVSVRRGDTPVKARSCNT